MQKLIPLLALLATRLLQEKVIPAVLVERQLAASCAEKALLGTAVGLELGHCRDRVVAKGGSVKGKSREGLGDRG
jgi:hypothetical protein